MHSFILSVNSNHFGTWISLFLLMYPCTVHFAFNSPIKFVMFVFVGSSLNLGQLDPCVIVLGLTSSR